MRRAPIAFVLLSAIAGASPGAAADAERPAWNAPSGEQIEALRLAGDPVRGKDAYAVCASCHLPSGAGRPDGTFPQLAGQHATVIIKQLADIRDPALTLRVYAHAMREEETDLSFTSYAAPAETEEAATDAPGRPYAAPLPGNPRDGAHRPAALNLGPLHLDRALARVLRLRATKIRVARVRAGFEAEPVLPDLNTRSTRTRRSFAGLAAETRRGI